MTNCEKCGNPLQPGLTACPICGTTAKSIDAPAAPVMQPAVETIGAATVANPVPQAQPAAPVIEPGPIAAPAPVPAPAPVMEAPAPVPAPVPAPAPVTPAPVMEAPVAAPAPAPVPTPVPAAPVVAEPAVAPAPVAEVPAPVPAPAPIMEAPAPVPAPVPAIEPLPAQGFSGAEVAAPVAPTPVADTPIPAPAVSNTIPAPAPAAPIAPAAPVEDKKGKKKKQKGNTGLVILVAIVALGLGLGAGYLLSPSLKAAPVPTTPAEEVSTAQPVSLNGFSFAVEEGWQYSQLGDKVIINNEDEAVLARLAVYDGVFENMNTTSIELSLSTKEGYSDIEVEKTTLGERDVIIVSAVNGESSVQYYYFAHTTEEVLSVTVIYAKSADKKTYEETVKALVEGTTYNDDAVNAIEAISPYSTLFDDSKSVYDSSFNDQKTNTEEQATGEQPETQNGEQTEPVTEEVVS